MEDYSVASMFEIRPYDNSYENLWEELVNHSSANGTFLQSRRFMKYHPAERFKECSLMIYNQKNQLVAVCPANTYTENEKRVFFSYKGATFGGLVISKKCYKAKYVLRLVRELKEYLKKEGFDEVYIKITPDIFSVLSTALLEYAFYYNGFEEYKELSTVILYEEYKEEILSNLTQGKRTHVHKCEKIGLNVRTLSNEEEIAEYYTILCENLEKYHTKPVHSLEELVDFKYKRLCDECEFWGTYLDSQMIAGGMLFYFNRTGIAHTQYLSAKKEYLTLSPMTYTYYHLIHEMRRRGYRGLSWGSSTENLGRTINESLIDSKESFGSSYSNNLTYHIVF